MQAVVFQRAPTIFTVLFFTLIFCENSSCFSLIDTIHFYLFPFSSDPTFKQEILIDDSESLAKSYFQKGLKTVIIIHGFWPNSTSFTPLEIKNAYLATHLPLNVIYLDWSYLSTPSSQNVLSGLKSYPEIVFQYIPLVAIKLSRFLNFLLREHYTPSHGKIHLVSYSLGAHVAGLAGQLIKISNRGEKIGRITALDPAAPLFRQIIKTRTYRLERNDADFVDVYHTSMNTLARHRKDGDVDFYPNGGRSPQPGCLFSELLQPIVCSHLFVVKLFIESIQNSIIACKCEPFIDYILGIACYGTCTERILVGDQCPSSARGQYFFTTGPLMGQIGRK